MVSTFRYWSFKEIDFARRRPVGDAAGGRARRADRRHHPRSRSCSCSSAPTRCRGPVRRARASAVATRADPGGSRRQGRPRVGRGGTEPSGLDSERRPTRRSAMATTRSRCCPVTASGGGHRRRRCASSRRRPSSRRHRLRVRAGTDRRRRHRRERAPAAAPRRSGSARGATPSSSARSAGPKWDDLPQESGPSAGLLRHPQGARSLREPAPRHVLPDAGGRLAAQALGRRGHRHHGDPRADRRALLRRAARRRALRRRPARAVNTMAYTSREIERVARMALRRGAQAPQAADLGGQGQRPGGVAAVARGRHARGRRTIPT